MSAAADDYSATDLDALSGVAAKLADAGLSPEFISHTIDLPLAHVKQIVLTRRRHPAPAPSELDEKITNEVNRLALACLKQAFLTVEFGPAEPRNAIVKTMVGGMVRAVTSGQSSETEEMRIAFTALLADMSSVTPQQQVVTEKDVINVAATPAPQPTDDQDEGFGVQTFDD